MVDCPGCSGQNPLEARFCSRCGTSLLSDHDQTTTIPAISEDVSVSLLDLGAAEVEAIHSLSADAALFIIRRGSGAGSRYLCDQPTTRVGRHPDSDIFFDDITVSRHHAKFVRQGAEMFVEDLGSTNGTYVNNTLVDGSAVLKLGDEVRIGKFMMTYFVGESA